MDIATFIEMYHDECQIIAWGCMVAYFALWFIVTVIQDSWYTARCNREASRCLGFHSGNITGFCNCRSCPYHAQCQHYAPPATFKERLYKLGRRIISRH